MAYLVDVNVWLALVTPRHFHHSIAMGWFDGVESDSAGICRITQLSLIRLLSSKSVLGDDVLSTISAAAVAQQLMDDDRVVFVEEPRDAGLLLDSLLAVPRPAPNLVTDAYLAAFAIGSSRKLVSLDRDFLSFKGLSVELLS